MAASELYRVTADGILDVAFHAGQLEAWDSDKRIIATLAGKQGGKTEFGPFWLYREMQRRGPGDYLVVTPTFPLLQRKCLPAFLKLFQKLLRLGHYNKSDKIFSVSKAGEVVLFGSEQEEPTQVFFGYAEDPESLASSTAKAAWCDEAGQRKFKSDSWDEIQARVAIHEGRILLTTTLYNLGWLVQQIWHPAREAGWDHPDIDVVRFESIQNPAFPEAEWERLKGTLPEWKFDLWYRGIPTRPAGLIYDAFDPARDKIPRFAIPHEWPRYLGVDFGGVNTAAVLYARNPGPASLGGVDAGQLVAYREYFGGGRTTAEHAAAIAKGEPGFTAAFGGARSEGQWRREFKAAGLTLRAPVVTDVEVGIDRVYGFHKRAELKVFSDLVGYLAEKETYSRRLDDQGEPLEAIEDKETYHHMDAERYILSYLAPSSARRPAMASSVQVTV